MSKLTIIQVFVLFLAISTSKSAPTGENKTLYDILSSDKRFEELVKQKFHKECKTARPICLALIDVTLRINEAHLSFTKAEGQHDDDFCNAKLLKVLPDSPTMDDTIGFSKSFNLTWFKDSKMCNDQCVYESYDDYSRRVKPACVFIYNNYKLLDQAKIDSGNNKTEKCESINVEQNKANETTGAVLSEAGTLVNVVEAKKSVTTQNVTVNKTEGTSEQEQVKASTNETKKVDDTPQMSTAASASAANKSETAQIKTDTKTTNINLDDQQPILGENQIFDQTQGPDNDDNANLENIEGGVNPDDDDDDLYSLDVPLRNNNLNVNKFPNEQESDIEPHDSDNPQRVQSAPFEEDPDSNFFTYLCIIMFLTILLYILYHNRQKILALLLEGRQGRNSRRPRSRGGSKAAYSKLDCNLEEAITSKKSLSGKSMDIIY